MRILAVDYGEKRVGLALSDPTATIAQSVGYVNPSPQAVLRVATERGAGRIVVGIPRRLDGTDSPQTTSARAFLAALQHATPLSVVGWDERLTTAEAERVLIAANVRRKDRREKIDQLAAQLLLQSYLDAHHQSPSAAASPPAEGCPESDEGRGG